MCVTNIYTDVYPTGEEGTFRQFSPCQINLSGQRCQSHTEYNNLPRYINYGEPTSAQMFSPPQGLQTPPRSSDSSIRPSIGIILGSDDGATSATGTYSTTSSGNHKRRSRGSKSKAMLGLMNIKVESSSEKQKRREREAKRDKIVYAEDSGPSSPQPYTRSIPGSIQFSQSIGVPYTPISARQQPPVVRRMPDTPPVVHDAFPTTPLTRHAYPQPPEMRNASPPRERSVSPVRILERDRRPHGPVQPPLIIQQQRPRGRDPSPPAVVVRAPTPPPQPPAPPAEIPLPTPSRSRSQSRVRETITTPPSPSSLHRESSRDGHRGRSPDPSSRRPQTSSRREESKVRRQRQAIRDEEIRNRPAVYPRAPMPPYSGTTPPEVKLELERERRPYYAPVQVVESSRRLNDMMGGLNIRNVGAGAAAPPVVTRPVVDSEMLGRLRDRQTPLRRRNTETTAQQAQGSERRRERHQVVYDDGRTRWE